MTSRAKPSSLVKLILERLPAQSAQPNIQTFGAAMAAFDMGECWSWALSLMEDGSLVGFPAIFHERSLPKTFTPT